MATQEVFELRHRLSPEEFGFCLRELQRCSAPITFPRVAKTHEAIENSSPTFEVPKRPFSFPLPHRKGEEKVVIELKTVPRYSPYQNSRYGPI
jgi:hypothetical protein